MACAMRHALQNDQCEEPAYLLTPQKKGRPEAAFFLKACSKITA
jgi:hypothetical protein